MRTLLATAPLLAALLLGGAPAPARAEASSSFAVNEVKTAAMKDYLREMRRTLKDQGERGKRLAKQTSEAFQGEADWGPATEKYYALRKDLIARAAAVESALDAAIAANTMESAGKVGAREEKLLKDGDVLRSDYELYARLPELAAGPDRKAAQASMRLLAQTGKYPMALAYFLDKTPGRKPFAPLSPALVLPRLPY